MNCCNYYGAIITAASNGEVRLLFTVFSFILSILNTLFDLTPVFLTAFYEGLTLSTTVRAILNVMLLRPFEASIMTTAIFRALGGITNILKRLSA